MSPRPAQSAIVPTNRSDIPRFSPKECPMRLGSVLAVVTFLVTGTVTLADEIVCPRSGCPFLPMTYVESADEQPADQGLFQFDNQIIDRPDRQVTANDWGGFPRLPGLRGVRGLTGVIGNLMQTNPHIAATWYPDQNVSGQPATLGMTREYFHRSS